jgi:hypothetical protein
MESNSKIDFLKKVISIIRYTFAYTYSQIQHQDGERVPYVPDAGLSHQLPAALQPVPVVQARLRQGQQVRDGDLQGRMGRRDDRQGRRFLREARHHAVLSVGAELQCSRRGRW